jgi:predicted MFS family arabinose efflux permease
VIIVLACVLGLASADASTVGASATELRASLGISNTDIGLLVAVTSLVAALASLPFGVLADRARRTWLLAYAVLCWGAAMVWSATANNFQDLLLSRAALGAVTAAGGPIIASLVGDYFPARERGRVYGFILAGELVGAGFGFAVTGDIAALSWRAAFVVLAVPALVLAWVVRRLPEPPRGGGGSLLNASPEASRRSGPENRPEADADELLQPTDAQRLARERGLTADPRLVLRRDPARMSLYAATRHVLRVRTNVLLIASSACGYYFLAGIQTFGVEFVKGQYDIGQVLANVMLLIVGVGAITGVLAGGVTGDFLLRRGFLNGRILLSAFTATAAVVLFLPPLFASGMGSALPYLIAATCALSAQNPPLDAARLDIMPALLWGRAEAVRTCLRAIAQALAPLLFGVFSDHLFGGGHTGLQWTFVIMLLPLAASAFLLFRALRTYPSDVASAAASPSPENAPGPASGARS